MVVVDNTEGCLEAGHDLVFHVCQVPGRVELLLQCLLVGLQLVVAADQRAADDAGNDRAPHPHVAAATPLHMTTLPAVMLTRCVQF